MNTYDVAHKLANAVQASITEDDEETLERTELVAALMAITDPTTPAAITLMSEAIDIISAY